jgi:hypothetical protein
MVRDEVSALRHLRGLARRPADRIIALNLASAGR